MDTLYSDDLGGFVWGMGWMGFLALHGWKGV